MKNQNQSWRVPLVALVVIYQLATLGCSIGVPPPESMLEDINRQQQASERQNERAAEMQKIVAAGAADLITADASARKDWIAVQSQIEKSRNDLVTQQSSILSGHDSLEAERKVIADQRVRGSVLVAVVKELGPALLCSVPLFLLLILLLRSDKTFRNDPFPDVIMDQFQIIGVNSSDERVDLTKVSNPRITAKVLDNGVRHEHC